jgi:hypothetical protein
MIIWKLLNIKRHYQRQYNLWLCRYVSQNVKIRIYKNIILPVVLYRCENWSLTLREGDTLRVFENRVLTGIFGPKRDEMKGGGENCIMRNFITCTIKSKRMRAPMGEKRNACMIFAGKPEGKRQLGIPRRRWVNNIKIDLREIGRDGIDWIDLHQDRD